jgi:hypothetical protein
MGNILTFSPWIRTTVLPIFLAIIFLETFQNFTDFQKKQLIKYTTAMILVSVLLNIRGLILHPTAARLIVGGRADPDQLVYYARQGISGYGFHSGIPPLIPVFYYMALNVSMLRDKWLLFIATALVTFVILLSATAASLLIASLALVLSIIGLSVYRKSLIVMIVIFSFLITVFWGPTVVLSAGINGLISVSPTEGLANRLRDVDVALREGTDVTAETSTNLTSFEGRYQRVFWNLESFASSPLGGTTEVPGAAGHLYWLYFLAHYGLIGFVPYAMLLYQLFKENYYNYNRVGKYFYSLAMAAFIIMGSIKNLTSWLMFFVPFALVPIYMSSVYQKSPRDGMHSESKHKNDI